MDEELKANARAQLELAILGIATYHQCDVVEVQEYMNTPDEPRQWWR